MDAGDKLFTHILELAKATTDYNLFSVLSSAVLAGPFSAEKYRGLLVKSMAELVARAEQEALFCNPVPLPAAVASRN